MNIAWMQLKLTKKEANTIIARDGWEMHGQLVFNFMVLSFNRVAEGSMLDSFKVKFGNYDFISF